MIHIDLNREQNIPLTRQIYEGMKAKILKGNLAAHDKLPSTRLLAQELSVSRTIVVEAYDQLLAEGYIYSIEGSGTYISEGVVYIRSEANKKAEVNEVSELLYPLIEDGISFRAGIPDLKSIPIKQWGKLYKRILDKITIDQLDYQSALGSHELRQAIASYLQRARGIDADPRQILIISGAAQGFSLLRTIVKEEEYVLVENPISKGIIDTFETNKIKYKPIEIDENGVRTTLLPKIPPKVILTTPSHQFPTGVVLSAKRRIELIQYAMENDCYICEDDYDSEFRYVGSPIQSLRSLEPEKVIYIGSFSKTFCPTLRMGYMILPKKLVKFFEKEKYGADLHSPIFEQLTMAAFINEGYFERHIRKMKKIYQKRRNICIERLTKTFGNQIIISGANAGLHFIVSFQGICFNEKNLKAIEREKLYIIPMELFFIGKQKYGNSLVFGFGNTDDEAIESGIKRLYNALYGIE